MVQNNLEVKYTDENIKIALSQWYYARDTVPPLQSVVSRLQKNEEENHGMGSSFIVHKAYSIFAVIHHNYLIIDGRVWHPGYVGETNIYYNTDNNPNSVVRKIEEYCHYCLYHYMAKKFEEDKKFNLLTNNCQLITGYFAVTILAFAAFVLIVIAGLTGSVLFLGLGFFSFSALVIYNLMNRNEVRLEVRFCPHIKKL